MRRPASIGLLLLIATSATLTGCGGGGSPSGPGGGGGTGSFTATISGQAWSSDALYLATASSGAAAPGSLVITGQQTQSTTTYRGLILTLGVIDGPGTYPLGVDGATVAGGNGSVLVAGGGGVPSSWLTPSSGASGTLTVTSLSSSRIAGTFSFTAAPVFGAGSSQTVTGGSFDVARPSNFVPASVAGSKMAATIGGTAFNAATVIALGGNGIFQLSGSSLATSVFIIPNNVQGPGTYQIGATVTLRVNLGASGWGGAGSTGTVTYTTLNASRAVGTFAGTLAPIGAQGNLPVTNGSFDIHLP